MDAKKFMKAYEERKDRIEKGGHLMKELFADNTNINKEDSELSKLDVFNKTDSDSLEDQLLEQEISFSSTGTLSSAAEELQLPDNVDLSNFEDEDGDSSIIPFPSERGRTKAEFEAQCEAQKQKNKQKNATPSTRTKADFEKTTEKSNYKGRTKEDFEKQCAAQVNARKKSTSASTNNIHFSTDTLDLSKNEEGFKPESRTIPKDLVDLENTIILSFPAGLSTTDKNVFTFTKGKYTYMVDLGSEQAKQDCLEALREKTHRSFAWYEEKTGKKNWVLYDLAQYEIEPKAGMYLHVKSFPIGTLEVPVGASSCYRMFSNMKIDEGISFTKAFDTSDIITMCGMFDGAHFTKGVYFPTTFNSKNVVDTRFMFFKAIVDVPFSFTNSFDGKHIISAEQMFCSARWNGDFYLPESFSPENAKSLRSMFNNFKVKGMFTLPASFNTCNVEDFSSMFCNFKFPEDFILPKDFSVENAKDLSFMFSTSVLPTKYNIVANFKTAKCLIFDSMFLKAILPDNFELPESFSTANATTLFRMFYDCKFPKGFLLPESFSTVNAKIISELFYRCVFKTSFSLPPAFTIENVEKKDFVFMEAKGLGILDLGLKHVVKTLHARYSRNHGKTDNVRDIIYNGMELPTFIRRNQK